MSIKDPEAIKFLIHHIVLPPKLPQADDSNASSERILLDTTIHALQNLKHTLEAKNHIDAAQQVAAVHSSISNLRNARNTDGYVCEERLASLLGSFVSSKDPRALPLEIKAQNAGIIVKRRQDDVVFEVFELSPRNEAVMSTKGRLIRSFPTYACALTIAQLREEGLIEALSHAIALMSVQELPEFKPQVRKAGKNISEIRDTTHPAMVTDYLVNVLAAVGKPIHTRSVCKSTREEVFWSDSLQPWRRSPLWLLVRLTMQLEFGQPHSESKLCTHLYKATMVYLLAYLLAESMKYQEVIGPSLLHCVSAKLNRRLRKLKHVQSKSLHELCTKPAHKILESAYSSMNAVWMGLTENASPRVDKNVLCDLKPDRDLEIKLPKLDHFIEEIFHREKKSGNSTFQGSDTFPTFLPTKLPDRFDAVGEYRYFELAAIEKWVKDHLASWVHNNIDDELSCQHLGDLIKSYHRYASDIYVNGGTPGSYSTMYLTIAELWVACDRCGCYLFPLLLDYDPEVCIEPLQSLSLPFKSQLERLSEVERYVLSRKRTGNFPSIFRDFGHPKSFAVRYFQESNELQALKRDVEEEASRRRQEKCQELDLKKRQYTALMMEADRMTCECYEYSNDKYGNVTKSRYLGPCNRCSCRSEAAALFIYVHEWPLSAKPLEANATIFELRIPASFSNWRDTTMYLMMDVLGFSRNQAGRPNYSYPLRDHESLSTYRKIPSDQRIGLLSTIKPHAGSHYKIKEGLSFLSESDVCVDSGLRYRYFDFRHHYFSDTLQPTDKMSKSCTYRLPSRSMQLQRYLRTPCTPGHVTANSVIASLSDCPTHLSLEEYKGFGTLSIGYNVVYMNILTQLSLPAIDFAKTETQCLIAHCIHLAGPPSGQNIAERVTHHIITNKEFCQTLIDKINIGLNRVRENWETWRALSIFIHLAQRVLSLTVCCEIRSQCFEFLRVARQVSLVWLDTLEKRMHSSTNDSQRIEIHSRITEIALLCISTFDVEGDNLIVMICSRSATSTLIRCSIIIQENKEATSTEHAPVYHAMLQCWRKLLFRVVDIIRARIIDDAIQAGFNEAVSASWEGFRPTGPWDVLESPQHHWIQTKSDMLCIHYNMITAELLVDGLPLSRLPREYLIHKTYLSLFRQIPIEVMPTGEPGMAFSAKYPFHEHELSFGMQSPDMLLVTRKDGAKFDLVPSRLLTNEIPTEFSENYFHWYNHYTDEVEFRPQRHPWCSNSHLWRLKRSGLTWKLVKGDSILVNPTSRTGDVLSKILAPIEFYRHIHISYDRTSKSVSIELPRLAIGFYIDPDLSIILSRQYRDMMIDYDQRIGTLIGLVNKLVLKHRNHDRDRLVLIPEGQVSHESTLNHVEVSIDPNRATNIHAYQINDVLRRLDDNGSLQSKLVLCYLHALTSHCLPDKFTGFTGTEAALSILRSAAVASSVVLTKQNLNILERIARLSPTRSYYPDHLKVMQQVCWDGRLSFLAQSSMFYLQVRALIDESRKTSLFHRGPVDVDSFQLYESKIDLLRRDIIRSSTFRVDGFGAERYTQDHDKSYQPRGEFAVNRGQQSFVAASLILRNNLTMQTPVVSERLQHSLRHFHFGKETVQGVQSSSEPAKLKYDGSWLKRPASFMPKMWCTLHSRLPSFPFNKFDIMMWLSIAAFAEAADFDLIQAFAAFYRLSELASIEIPRIPSFDLSRGDDPTLSQVTNLVDCTYSFWQCPESKLSQRRGESEKEWEKRARKRFQNQQTDVIKSFSHALHAQWPCARLTQPAIKNAEVYLDINEIMCKARSSFEHWYNNRRFFQYLKTVAETLARQRVNQTPLKTLHMVVRHAQPERPNSYRYFGAKDIFAMKAPLTLSSLLNENEAHWPKVPIEPELPLTYQDISDRGSKSKMRLDNLCDDLTNHASCAYEKHYLEDLRNSCKLLANQESVPLATISPEFDPSSVLQSYMEACQRYLLALHTLLTDTVQSVEPGASICQSPRTSPLFWIQQLHKDYFDALDTDWKIVIVKYGLAVTKLQRSRRLLSLMEQPSDFAKELLNRGHQNWNPMEYPETLLLEAESGILVREVQEEIAKHMRYPPKCKNSVMQLNMGEGKSSVIVPMVAAALANTETLVRIIVAKPQARQMFQMLVSKLGGLLNRRIYHMPFSRDLALSVGEVNSLGMMYLDCMAKRGVMLVQPEHLLSFQLMGMESLISGRPDLAQSFLRTQDFFDAKSRDIVDESDENFSVKFELIYTMGTQQDIEMSPERWTIAQSILGLVAKYAPKVKSQMPSSIDVDSSQDERYPRVRVFRSDASDKLLDLIADHICTTGFPGLAVARQPRATQESVYIYIRHPRISSEEQGKVENGPFWTDSTKDSILLLRGLIAGGVLQFALRAKRWRVNYGTDSNRSPATKLAVPYRSKDSPSPRSEFSHPDVVIILTSLSYYYGGLNDEELFDTLSHLLKSDQGETEYEEWVRSVPSLPQAFRSLTGVNIKDHHQCRTEVFPILGYSKGAIDYFLSHIVFPKEMKEFPYKLAASGWDIGAVKKKPITGFSGTNDSRHILPLSVNHLDLEQQEHTNALVLSYLLQDENSVKLLDRRGTPGMSGAEHLLKTVSNLERATQVVLDVGAQILELNNYQIAETWLQMSNASTAKAVVFFDDNEELSVLDRSGHVELLQTSAFAKDLQDCLIYLDEAHTRGTDLKLPQHYRAAVTLGANVTKDRLVQACMRMRKLGKGQSVVFCISEEIQTRILGRTSKTLSSEIEVSDVLKWAITETWDDSHRSIHLWSSQGHRHETHKKWMNGSETTKEQAENLLEEESQTVERRYRPTTQSHAALFSGWDKSNPNIEQIIKRCQSFGTAGFDSVTLQEEQERELSPEAEEERQAQRPTALDPAEHELHPDVVHLVKTGKFVIESKAFMPAFQSLASTSAAASFSLAQFPTDLQVTADFMRTVKQPKDSLKMSWVSDSYLRPVQWILSTEVRETESAVTGSCRRLLIISPYEADKLLPRISTFKKVTLHTYAPRLNRSYDPLDHLDLHCIGRDYQPAIIPRSQTVQLNLFAGQLYFSSYDEYKELCHFLGLAYTTAGEGQLVQADGFVLPPIGQWAFQSSPVRFLERFIKIRRDGEGMDKTQVGRVLRGDLLEGGEFEQNSSI